MNVLMGDSKPPSPVYVKTGTMDYKDINNGNTHSSNSFRHCRRARNSSPSSQV
jgi:hypothetical protein